MLATIAILAILMSLGAPSLTRLVRDQRVKTATFDVYAALIYARSEAIKRNSYVAVCAKNDGGWGCQNSADWSRGWIVFEDPDGNGFPNSVTEVIRRQDALSDIALTGVSGNVTYQRDGRVRGAVAVADFVVSVPSDTSVTTRCVRVDLSGQPNIKAGC